jgi:hypothetical protein
LDDAFDFVDAQAAFNQLSFQLYLGSMIGEDPQLGSYCTDERAQATDQHDQYDHVEWRADAHNAFNDFGHGSCQAGVQAGR